MTKFCGTTLFFLNTIKFRHEKIIIITLYVFLFFFIIKIVLSPLVLKYVFRGFSYTNSSGLVLCWMHWNPRTTSSRDWVRVSMWFQELFKCAHARYVVYHEESCPNFVSFTHSLFIFIIYFFISLIFIFILSTMVYNIINDPFQRHTLSLIIVPMSLLPCYPVFLYLSLWQVPLEDLLVVSITFGHLLLPY